MTTLDSAISTLYTKAMTVKNIPNPILARRFLFVSYNFGHRNKMVGCLIVFLLASRNSKRMVKATAEPILEWPDGFPYDDEQFVLFL